MKRKRREMEAMSLSFLDAICCGFGAVILLLVISKIIDTSNSIVDRPPFYISLTLMIMGMQLFTAGFLGELISRNSPGRNFYLVEKKIGIE